MYKMDQNSESLKIAPDEPWCSTREDMWPWKRYMIGILFITIVIGAVTLGSIPVSIIFKPCRIHYNSSKCGPCTIYTTFYIKCIMDGVGFLVVSLICIGILMVCIYTVKTIKQRCVSKKIIKVRTRNETTDLIDQTWTPRGRSYSLY